MKVGVIGTVNRDTVRLPDGSIRKGWGGILYNIITFSKLIGDQCDIYPAANIGFDSYKSVTGILNKFRGVRLDYLKKVSEKNNHCFLSYQDYESKSEILKGGVKPLKYDDVRPLLKCDTILVNYISGRDIYLKSLRKLRQNFKGQIYVDIHSLTLGKRKDGRRYLRHPPNWPTVMETADYIQLNRLELDILSSAGKTIGKEAASPVSGLKNIVRILDKNRIKTANKVLIVTDGDNGCYLYSYHKNRWQFRHVPARKRANRKDTTGCGDCFSAGFISGLLESTSLSTCAEKANRAALNRIEGNVENA